MTSHTSGEYDVLVVGAGPAGLSAALYLARYDRSVALFDAGHGRSTWHQVNHNYLGFPGGVSIRTLRELGRRQLEEYAQVSVFEHKVEAMARLDDAFEARGQAGLWRGRAVILCPGVIDHWPHFEGWSHYVGRSLFWCLTCDGYGCKGVRTVVAGNTDRAAQEALQLSRFTDRLTVLTDSHDNEISPAMRGRLQRAGIKVIDDRIKSVEGDEDKGQLRVIWTQNGHCIELDQLFSLHGATPATGLALHLGVSLTPDGYITVDEEQRTSVPGVFAAGDATRLHSHQVSTAVHEGGQAASSANYYLYPPDLKGE